MSMYMPNYEMPSSRLGNEGICTHCLKITQNVSFEFLNCGIFQQFFCPTKIQKLAKLSIFGIFN